MTSVMPIPLSYAADKAGHPSGTQSPAGRYDKRYNQHGFEPMRST